ncbi:MAG: DUF3750 domain-containing protein [Rhodoferax sp.]|nr:DUF3750 domain-containing protein [Rhodoferax sp.]
MIAPVFWSALSFSGRLGARSIKRQARRRRVVGGRVRPGTWPASRQTRCNGRIQPLFRFTPPLRMVGAAIFAVHPWSIYKRQGETAYTRYDVVGWRASQVVQRNYALPDGLWYGSTPDLLVDHRGDAVESMIDEVEAAVASYPFADHYLSYPGPNSNTFLAHIGRQVPALKLDLPANAVGKDYRALSDPVGRSASGSGLQMSLLG